MKNGDDGNESDWRNRKSENLISDLRHEVTALKTCVAQYSLQAIGFSAIVWGLFLKPELRSLIVVFACGTTLNALLLMVAGLANHKYATINRNLAYELHLYRLKHYAGPTKVMWFHKMAAIGWEEAMCAWRIVEATMHDALYCPHFWTSRISERFREFTKRHPRLRAIYIFLPILDTRLARNMKYPWHSTPRLLGARRASYSPGAYLRNTQAILYAVVVLSLGVMAFLTVSIVNAHAPGVHTYRNLVAEAAVALEVLLAFALIIHQYTVRKILECELLSIQSSAVVWRLVTTCHILATLQATTKHRSYKQYTNYLADLCEDLAGESWIQKPHEWLDAWHSLDSEETVNEKLNTVCKN